MRLSPWKLMSLEQRERLRPEEGLFPYPALFAFGLILILTGHLLPGLNPRLGSRIQLISFDSPRQHEGSLWLGISKDQENVTVITPDRKMFTLTNKDTQRAGFDALVEYLQSYVEHQTRASSLRGEADATQAKAILAVDRSLNYAHLNPVLLALAQARITRYGFETLTTK